MTLSEKELALLKAPLPLEDGHELRVAQELQGGNRAQWLVYTTEQPVRDRLTEVDVAWSMHHVETLVNGKSASVTVELTVCGVTRCGTGSNDSDYNDLGNIIKGAATDALKRVARNFDIGAYLLKAPDIYTDWAPKPPKGATPEQRRAAYNKRDQAEKDAFAQFARWYQQQFGGGKPPATKSGQESDTPARKSASRKSTGKRAQQEADPVSTGEYDIFADKRAFEVTMWPKMKPILITAKLADNSAHAEKRLRKVVLGADAKGDEPMPEVAARQAEAKLTVSQIAHGFKSRQIMRDLEAQAKAS